ncbi:hypothetical protein [Nocardioides lianchengensis]|uniref:Uncharacterized protein n=1 Tax=Nocardioides lianchengensis TaxID=1045774 RepID=A0A1G6TKR6_9ACTN|nr:hypothetical protein [Nocardioides lianchengensis]NYG11742.1 hypothetical protein [Nocardioides lianchengensis]SDD28915.1 hypothetical protein SAMN05421872_10791 [Nocardioides lianchengensis]
MSAATTRRRAASRVLLAAALLLASVAGVLPMLQGSADAATGAAVTKTVTATRAFLDEDGTRRQVSSNRVTLAVSQTQDLRGRQEIHVSWSGAIPTGGIVTDPNASDGRNQEYPFVLLQCRGVDTTGKVPAGQARLTPETCWTQTSPERYLAAASHTPSWRFDAYAPAAERGAVVGQPANLPAACAELSQPLTARWVPFRSAGGEVFYGGPDPGAGCTPLAPESDSAEGGGLTSNTTYGITGTDGRGEADFAVWTAAENQSLGCSVSVDCALVAVPIVGLSCDAWGRALPAGAVQTTKAGAPLTAQQLTTADTTCRRTGAYEPGMPRSSESTDQAVRGNLWWAASNWRNRITVPLDFAVTGSVCDTVSKEPPVELMGSVVVNELTASWRPAFCTSKDLFTFTHVQQADSLARTLVEAGEIDGAFSSAPKAGGYGRPVVQAPLAIGGFALAFTIDDADKQRRETLNLNARLVAKLLSASYPASSVVRDYHEGLDHNPLNITLDPEFQALNPGLPQSASLESGAALQVFSANTDLVWALSSWIDSDPEARAWLDGYADPWGMTVNEAYRGLDLPVDNWPLLDEFVAPDWYKEQNACYKNSPTPFLQLVANPPSNLAAVLVNMQYAKSAVATVCRYDGNDPTSLPLRQQGRQDVGYRFVLGLVSVSSASRYNLRTAALQTTSAVKPAQRFTDTTGRRFVRADLAGLRAASQLLEADDEAGTWRLDYGRLSTDDGAAAYPGALPVYAVLPTSGLDDKTATRLAKLLCYSHTRGQRSGAANGRLPVGYLPVTAANGLGAEQDYVLNAAAAVRAQDREVPALDAAPTTRAQACDFSAAKPTATSSPSPSDSPSPSEPTAPSVTPPTVPAAAVPSAPVPTATVPTGVPSVSTAPIVEAATVATAGQSSDLGRLGVPFLLLLAFASALTGVVLRWLDELGEATRLAWAEARGWVRR